MWNDEDIDETEDYDDLDDIEDCYYAGYYYHDDFASNYDYPCYDDFLEEDEEPEEDL